MAQQWVPQYVLQGFSADGKTIWQYDKTGELAATRVGIKGACGRNDALSVLVERLLATIESAANPAIEAFRCMEHAMRIDPVAKRIVAVYLNMFLWKRSQTIRDQQVAGAKEATFLDLAHHAAKRYGVPGSLNRDILPAVAARAASHAIGGSNPTVPELENLSAWYRRMSDDDSDSADRHWCMAPGAGDQCRHNWKRAPFELSVVTETQMPECLSASASGAVRLSGDTPMVSLDLTTWNYGARL